MEFDNSYQNLSTEITNVTISYNDVGGWEIVVCKLYLNLAMNYRAPGIWK